MNKVLKFVDKRESGKLYDDFENYKLNVTMDTGTVRMLMLAGYLVAFVLLIRYSAALGKLSVLAIKSAIAAILLWAYMTTIGKEDVGIHKGLIYGTLCPTVIFFVYTVIMSVAGHYTITGICINWKMLIGIAIAIVTPVTEEIVFRGVILEGIKSYLGGFWALILSSFMFSCGHFLNKGFNWPICITLALSAGLVFGYIYMTTGSIWYSIFAHWAWNILQGRILGYSVSGSLTKNSLLQVEISGPGWITGGVFGPEGSILLVAISILFCIGLKHFVKV